MRTVSETMRGWAGQEAAPYLTGFIAGDERGTLHPLAAVLPFLVGDATRVLLAFLLTGTIRKMSLGRR